MDLRELLRRCNAASAAGFFLYGYQYDEIRIPFEEREPAIFAKFQAALDRNADAEELSKVFAECAKDLAVLYTEVGMGIAARLNAEHLPLR